MLKGCLRKPTGAELPPSQEAPEEQIGFPEVKKSHIINCSFHSWYPKFHDVTPAARLIPLSKPFLSYLRADGIILPSDDCGKWPSSDDDRDSGVFSAPASDTDLASEDEKDIAADWRDIHNEIRSTIKVLGGSVHPKLNWSAPKDATWVTNTRSMACNTPSDIYLLMKSSDFVSHDLHHLFDDTVDDLQPQTPPKTTPKKRLAVNFADTISEPIADIYVASSPPQLTEKSYLDPNGVNYHLVLRRSIPEFVTALEFRCFVRDRKLIGISQREKSYLPFLFRLRPRLDHEIRMFFHTHIRHAFPDPNFAFDVYVPEPFNRVWLVDINPWAPRTDSLLFDWEELLSKPTAPDVNDSDLDEDEIEALCTALDDPDFEDEDQTGQNPDVYGSSKLPSGLNSYDPHFRLLQKNDPSGWHVAAPQYSAHKLPKDVLDAGACGGAMYGLREFADTWSKAVERLERNSKAKGEPGDTASFAFDSNSESDTSDSESDSSSSGSDSDSDDDSLDSDSDSGSESELADSDFEFSDSD